MKTSAPAPTRSSVLRSICIAAALATITAITLWPVIGNEYLSYDDPHYASQNFHVLSGLSVENLIWAFSTTEGENWHPVTWLANMSVVSAFGRGPRPQHFVNLAFHVANTILAFVSFRLLTGSVWRSALVAALFGVHPLHVESVAWIAERKDVVSTFFGLIAVIAYVRFARSHRALHYGILLLAFAMSLLSKPMLVTMPFVLLLFDWWPLQRLRGATDWFARIREKLPLFVLALGISIVTLVVQSDVETMAALDVWPLAARVENAAVSYAAYLVKTVWPTGLAPIYPLPRGGHPTAIAIGSIALLTAVSSVAFRERQTRPWIAAGWCFYLGTLVPVIGLVQVGSQAMADRYTYVPLLGIFWIASWCIPAIPPERTGARAIAVGGCVLVVSALAACSWRQSQLWHDDLVLFSHALDVTRDNAVAHVHVGNALQRSGRLDEAVAHYRVASEFQPTAPFAWVGLANALIASGRAAEALPLIEQAIRARPDWAEAHVALGNAHLAEDRIDLAELAYRRAIALEPHLAEAHNNLGVVLVRTDSWGEATREFEAALRYRSDYPEARANLAAALGLLEGGAEPTPAPETGRKPRPR